MLYSKSILDKYFTAYWGRRSQGYPVRKLLYPGTAKSTVINKLFFILENRLSGRMFGGGNQFIIVIPATELNDRPTRYLSGETSQDAHA